jgi:hypothetical protein
MVERNKIFKRELTTISHYWTPVAMAALIHVSARLISIGNSLMPS